MKKLWELPAVRAREGGVRVRRKAHLQQGAPGRLQRHDSTRWTSPHHLKVADTDLCSDDLREEYGNPCENFCPAAVYEMVDGRARSQGRKKLFIHHENCVHCKTCDIADPYAQVITWTTPEGGEGPDYTRM